MAIPESSLTGSPTPLVSVSMTAYNLAKWLPRALNSVLAQEATFPIEIVIGDDCSKDETVSIAHSYRERFPNMIRVLERSKNVGIQRNTYDTFEQCRGKYVAWLDADDYWTDPRKLAIQVETMESDPTISVCCNFCRWVTPDGEVRRETFPGIPAGRYGLNEILRHNLTPSLTAMFRNGLHRQLGPWYFEFQSMSDWPLWVLAALSGDIVLIDRNMADYMLTPGSSMMSRGAIFWNQMTAEFYEKIESVIPPEWRRLARSEKGKRYEALAYLLRKRGDFTASREAAVKAFRAPSMVDNFGSKTKSLLAATVRETEWRLRGSKTTQ
jgi:glycosyltransferase involved in cell wall biosynthesis